MLKRHLFGGAFLLYSENHRLGRWFGKAYSYGFDSNAP